MPRNLEEKIRKYIFYIFLLTTLFSCKIQEKNIKKKDFPDHNFDINLVGEAPNYSKMKRWIEHPDKESHYAILPKNYDDSLFNTNPSIDVFFIHPTIYTKGKRWNADINNEDLNQQIGDLAIRYQASVFLGIANIYAPHYRQMHIHSYSDLKNGYLAYDIAYSDVKKAFLFYWKNNNKLKKFIIAGHSQGTNHGERLLKEVILKNDTMKALLTLSYLPGMPIKQFHKDLPNCTNESQLECIISWRTLAEGYFPKDWEVSDSISCINPISWKIDSQTSKKENHLGILFRNHKIYYPNSLEVYNHNGVVWVKPIKIPFAHFYKMENYHVADYNLFWVNIRNNLRYRLSKRQLDE